MASYIKFNEDGTAYTNPTHDWIKDSPGEQKTLSTQRMRHPRTGEEVDLTYSGNTINYSNIHSKARDIANLISESGTIDSANHPVVFKVNSTSKTVSSPYGNKLGDFWYDPDTAIMSICIEVGGLLQWKEL